MKFVHTVERKCAEFEEDMDDILDEISSKSKMMTTRSQSNLYSDITSVINDTRNSIDDWRFINNTSFDS